MLKELFLLPLSRTKKGHLISAQETITLKTLSINWVNENLTPFSIKAKNRLPKKNKLLDQAITIHYSKIIKNKVNHFLLLNYWDKKINTYLRDQEITISLLLKLKEFQSLNPLIKKKKILLLDLRIIIIKKVVYQTKE